MAPLCHFFQKGTCRRGSKCTYSHDTSNSSTTPASNLRAETYVETLARHWTYLTPNPNAKAPRPMRRDVDPTEFFQTASKLMEIGDDSIRQTIIIRLGTESGLAIAKKVTDKMKPTDGEEQLITLYRSNVIFMLRVIAHREALSSLLLETPVYAIYTFLYGPGGRRGLDLFLCISKALQAILRRSRLDNGGHSTSSHESETADEEDFITNAIESSVTVLDHIIEINQTAQVLEGFVAIVETISSFCSADLLSVSTQQSLTRIRRRLNIGSALPVASSRAPALNTTPVGFELHQDLPGALSTDGPRHNNDHENIIDIRILPTADEISSQRQEYLPTIDANKSHLSGLKGLLDRQFRLLREDTVGQLRDAVREEVLRLQQPEQNASTTQQGRQGVRRIVYHNVRFEQMRVDRRGGLQFITSFDQPISNAKKSLKQREEWWNSSKLLRPDSLVCFVSSRGKAIFMTVCDSRPPKARNTDAPQDPQTPAKCITSLFDDPNFGFILLTLAEYKEEDLEWISTQMHTQNTRQSLVEFPGVLLPSFNPTLKALQKMSRKLDLPFADLIAPEPLAPPATMKPPAYATERGFSYDLGVLTGTALKLTPGESFDFSKLSADTSLDEAQQHAVVRALNTGLALIQGPPGTGKSYTGEAIIKILLHNRSAANLGPVICVCYTNHALDQLLEHLVKGGIRQVIRLGSRSKSDIIQSLSLRKVIQEAEVTKEEKHDRWESNQSLNADMEDIETILSMLNTPGSPQSIETYLSQENLEHRQQLSDWGTAVDEEGFQTVQYGRYNLVEQWLRGAPIELDSRRSIPELQSIHLAEMSGSERNALYQHWMKEHTAQLLEELCVAMESFHASRSDLDACHSELELRCLRQAHIIGVTTAGLARNVELLKRVHAKVMLCEEAGEVLEAHTLTALLPGIEHAILIGDHEQLRPQINNYDLQHDSASGKRYALDVSLFERLVKPAVGSPQVPLSTLQIQRRMYPSISELVRIPLYPNLQDHETVSKYPEVEGMRHRLYWLNHQEKEDARNAQAVSLSRSNSFEVDLVAALVSHLVKQGKYASEDIAVLTPYLGQLQKIRKRLAATFEIVVGDRDLDELKAKGLEDEPKSAIVGRLQKTTLLNALRIATVDNFQGEEAKVIFISLVRCNDERNCGFLKTSNRINVLLSRARHGMYIIGNSDTARPVPMWNEVISILERSGNIGPHLALCCSRHKDTPIEVSVPDDFVRLAPEGGCALRCTSRLLCGHACPNMCHSSSLHDAVRCLERCQRTKSGCDHECPKPCGDMCDDKCQAILSNIQLPCGHIAEKLRCYEAQSPEQVLCTALVNNTMPHCEHEVQFRCHQLPLDADHPCPAVCDATLNNCGHNCKHACKDCTSRSDGEVSVNHKACITLCGRAYSTCKHHCKTACHGDVPCSPCKSACAVSCAHSSCSKSCNEPCVPCAEDCARSCPHRGSCPYPCAVPCDELPCSERCPKLLDCGHRCPTICGETCPPAIYCQTCATPNVKEMVVDFIMGSTYNEINLSECPCIIPSCGHIVTLETMDGHMSMVDHYIFDTQGLIIGLKHNSEPFSASEMKSCPTCRGPLRDLKRYSRVVNRALIDESTKKFIVWANAAFVPLITRMQVVERDFREAASKPSPSNRITLEHKGPALVGPRDVQIMRISLDTANDKQMKTAMRLRTHINRFLQQVNEKEQPFGRIYDLMQDAQRNRGVQQVSMESHVGVLQVRNRLLATVLLFRCDYTILLTYLDSRKGLQSTNPGTPDLTVDLSAASTDCVNLIEESIIRHQPATEVEGHLYWARFASLQKSFMTPSDELDNILEGARQHLDIARRICNAHPGHTPGLQKEIEEVEVMLRGTTFYLPVSNEEKAAVYAAMAQSFSGTGHWYYCENGHPFTVGECGAPMETSTCPQCGSPVGGTDHRAHQGVTRAGDMDEMFGRLHV